MDLSSRVPAYFIVDSPAEIQIKALLYSEAVGKFLDIIEIIPIGKTRREVHFYIRIDDAPILKKLGVING